jgi:hypothetical protein
MKSFYSLVGSLMHIIVNTQLDCSYVVGSLTQYLSNPTHVHWQAIKHALQYIQVKINHWVKYHMIENGVILYIDILTFIKFVIWTPHLQPQVIALFLQAK